MVCILRDSNSTGSVNDLVPWPRCTEYYDLGPLYTSVPPTVMLECCGAAPGPLEGPKPIEYFTEGIGIGWSGSNVTF